MQIFSSRTILAVSALFVGLAHAQILNGADLALGGTHEAMFEREASDDGLFEREAEYVHARQAASTASAPVAGSSSSSSSAAAAAGATGSLVNVTLAPDAQDPSGCTMNNNFEPGQSASWTDLYASTCCINATYATCFGRDQTHYNGSIQCVIPPCSVLMAGNRSAMSGFTPLSSSSGGVGEYKNAFLIVKAPSAALSNARVGFGLVASAALIATGFSLL